LPVLGSSRPSQHAANRSKPSLPQRVPTPRGRIHSLRAGQASTRLSREFQVRFP
jgi:hypothetical protein